MIIHLAALILLTTVSLVQTDENRQLISVREVHVGENVTLKCRISKDTRSYIWFKQSLGYLETMASLTHDKWTFREPFNKDSRLHVTTENDHHLLTIRNVSKEDEATYFCQYISTFSSGFISVTFLAVKDCCWEKTVKVKQSPETAAAQPGDSVSLRCSLSCQSKETSIQCPDENSVYWFRASSEGVNSGIFNNPRNRSVKKEERSCVYSLSTTIQNSSDAGTYYCAVLTCGGVLFGEGTKVETDSGSELSPFIPTLGVLLACCVTVVTVLIFFIKQRRVCDRCKGETTFSHVGREQSAVGSSRDVAMTYAASDYPRRRQRGMNENRDTLQECIYQAIGSGPVSLWRASDS